MTSPPALQHPTMSFRLYGGGNGLFLNFVHYIYFSFTAASRLRSMRMLLADAIEEVDCCVLIVPL